MAKYKKDSSRVLKENVRYNIPLNEAEPGSTCTVLRLQFHAGDTIKHVKQQLRAVLKCLGCNKRQANQYIKQVFPEVFNG